MEQYESGAVVPENEMEEIRSDIRSWVSRLDLLIAARTESRPLEEG